MKKVPVVKITTPQTAADLANIDAGVDLSDLEAEFEKVAGSYNQRHGITYAAWRHVGIEPAVLKKAGISRTTN